MTRLLVLIGATMATLSADEQQQNPPTAIAGWRAKDPGTRYDPESIFAYLDGHAELYLAYGMRSCFARRYAGPEGEADLILDVFEMATAADAYGIFSHDQDGEAMEIGRGALLRYGWLSFWKGRLFVSVFAERDSERARAAVLELGRAVAAAIEDTGEPPEIVARLPVEGLEPRSVRYLHHPQLLKVHVPFGEGNPLQLGPESALALGRYRRDGQQARLLLVEYRQSSDVQKAMAAFSERFLRGRGPTRSQDGWHAMRRMSWGENALGFVTGADSSDLAETLLAAADVAEKGGRR